MSKNVAVFVDVANLYYAARGQDVDVDYVALLKHATKGRDLIRAYAYSGLDPENENQKKFLDFLGKNGYRVVAKDIRKFGDGRVKANLDIELVVDLFRLADRMDVAVIVSGDGDFAPAIRALQDEGVRCEVISFKPNTSSDLFAVADEFHDVMKISAIGRQKDAKGVSAPEMPAKEVNPDVGFREASPSVAAAALAAIRSNGDEPTPGRGRGRAAGRRTAGTGRSGRGRSRAAAEEPVAAAEAPASAVTEPAGPISGAAEPGQAGVDSGRRRRRRGGRGRGRRGRRGGLDLAEVPTDGEPTEITWEEVDSLEALEGLDEGALAVEREVQFEEADADTLAELGLTDQPVPTEPVAAQAVAAAERREEPKAEEPAPAPKPKTRARSGSRTTSTAAAGTTSRTTTKRSTAKPSTRTSRTTPAKAAAKAGAKAPAKPAAKPRSTTAAKSASKPRAAKTAAEPAPTDASDQGIWQRFTSGRGTRKRPAPETPSGG